MSKIENWPKLKIGQNWKLDKLKIEQTENSTKLKIVQKLKIGQNWKLDKLTKLKIGNWTKLKNGNWKLDKWKMDEIGKLEIEQNSLNWPKLKIEHNWKLKKEKNKIDL